VRLLGVVGTLLGTAEMDGRRDGVLDEDDAPVGVVGRRTELSPLLILLALDVIDRAVIEPDGVEGFDDFVVDGDAAAVVPSLFADALRTLAFEIDTVAPRLGVIVTEDRLPRSPGALTSDERDVERR